MYSIPLQNPIFSLKENSDFFSCTFSGYGRIQLTTHTVGLQKLNWLNELFNNILGFFNVNWQQYATIHIDNQKLHLDVEKLTDFLGIDESKIRTAIKTKTLQNVIFNGVASKFSQVSYENLEEISDNEKNQLHFVTQLGFSGKDFIASLAENKGQEFLDRATAFNLKCSPYFTEAVNILKTEVPDVNQLEEEKLKQVVTTLVKLFDDLPNAPKNSVFCPIPISERISLVATTKPNSTELTILTLFGNAIYSNDEGEIIVLKKLLSNSNETSSVISKRAKSSSNGYEKKLKNEEYIVNYLHRNGIVRGIEPPMLRYHNKTNSKNYLVKVLHTGSLFSWRRVTYEQARGVALQLLEGLVHMHDKEISHLDIKRENIFYKEGADNQKIPAVFIGDFAGAHQKNHTDLNQTFIFTPECTNLQEINHLNPSHSSEYFERRKKIDINCICKVLLEIAFEICNNENELVYTKNNVSLYYKDNWGNPEMMQALVGQLTSHYGAPMAQLILQGLDPDYTKRPEAQSLLNALKLAISPEELQIIEDNLKEISI